MGAPARMAEPGGRTWPRPVVAEGARVEEPRHVYYSWEEFKRILTNWPRWSAMLYVERRRFEEGGRIDRIDTPSDASFTVGVLAYFDLELYTLRVRFRLGERAEDVFRDYWQRQLTHASIADSRRMSFSTVTAMLWSFTEDVAELMVRRGGKDGPTPAERVREWKEYRKGKARDFV